MTTNSLSPRPLPVFQDENVSYSTKKMSGRKQETKPPKLDIKKSRCVLFPTKSNAKPLNSDSNLSVLYDDTLNETYFEQCFENIKKLGEGSFGEVYKVRYKEDGLLYAVKKTRRAQLNEVRRYELVPPHPNCVRLYKAWEEHDNVFMQMELCDDNLDRYTSVHHDIPESLVWNILLDLTLGLQNLHQKNLLHLDIKPANILMCCNGTCKLGDFGLLFDLDNGKDTEAVEGDCKYMAPELMTGVFTKAADIYSLGITILEVACDLDLPTNGPLWHDLRSGHIPDRCFQVISMELIELISKMIAHNRDNRPTVESLLRHERLQALLKERYCNLGLMHYVKYTVSDWILQKIITFASGFCIQFSKMYKKAFWKKVHRKTLNKTICKRESVTSPGKNLRRINLDSLTSSVANNAVRIQIRRPTESSISTSENDSIERLDMPQDEIISSTSDYMDTRNFESPSPRLRRMLHSTPIAHTSVKKLFNGLDSDDDY